MHEPGDTASLLRELLALPAEWVTGGKHAVRVVCLDGERYVIKLDREPALCYLAYWARVRHLNLLADDFVAPLPRRARIRAATLAMRAWRACGFGAPEPLNGPDDDFLCYRFLPLPSLRERLRAGEPAPALLGLVSAAIYERHQAAGADARLFHLDSRCANILLDDARPVWVDFDRGFAPETPPVLLKARELVTFARSAAKLGQPAAVDERLAAIARRYPDGEVWAAAVGWLRQASRCWQEPAAILRRRRCRSFQNRAALADRLEAVALDRGR
jgi:hypothetical protein